MGKRTIRTTAHLTFSEPEESRDVPALLEILDGQVVVNLDDRVKGTLSVPIEDIFDLFAIEEVEPSDSYTEYLGDD